MQIIKKYTQEDRIGYIANADNRINLNVKFPGICSSKWINYSLNKNLKNITTQEYWNYNMLKLFTGYVKYMKLITFIKKDIEYINFSIGSRYVLMSFYPIRLESNFYSRSFELSKQIEDLNVLKLYLGLLNIRKEIYLTNENS